MLSICSAWDVGNLYFLLSGWIKEVTGDTTGRGVEEGNTLSSVATVTNDRNPGLDCQWQRSGVEVRKLFSCRLWCLHPWTLILCDFYGRLSSGKQLGGDAVLPSGGGSVTFNGDCQPPWIVAGVDSPVGVPQPHFVV